MHYEERFCSISLDLIAVNMNMYTVVKRDPEFTLHTVSSVYRLRMQFSIEVNLLVSSLPL